MGIALGIIGMLATIAGIVLLIIALVRKSGWGVARSLAILVVGIILFFVGVFTSPTPEGVSPTPPSEVGKSRLNPVPFGSSLTYGDQRVTVLGSQQSAEIGWSTPDEGNVYLAVKIKVDFLGDSLKSQRLRRSDFEVVGNSGYIYKPDLFVDTETPLIEGYYGDYYGGATTSGDLVYEIKQNETNMVLIWHCGLVTDRFLEIP